LSSLSGHIALRFVDDLDTKVHCHQPLFPVEQDRAAMAESFSGCGASAIRSPPKAVTSKRCSLEARVKKIVSTALSLVAMLTASKVVLPASAGTGSAYDFGFKSIDGKPMPLSDYRGKVLLVVNTASFCGFTKQYAGLQELWSKYEARGLTVIGVPSNDFGGQEPKAEGDIKSFCEGAFGVTFPLTSKQVVSGDDAHPFYKWATSAAGPDGAPQWNFHKFLIGRDGRMIASLSTRLTPTSPEVIGAIEAALAEPGT
jgi:glutathione peroxidase